MIRPRTRRWRRRNYPAAGRLIFLHQDHGIAVAHDLALGKDRGGGRFRICIQCRRGRSVVSHPASVRVAGLAAGVPAAVCGDNDAVEKDVAGNQQHDRRNNRRKPQPPAAAMPKSSQTCRIGHRQHPQPFNRLIKAAASSGPIWPLRQPQPPGNWVFGGFAKGRSDCLAPVHRSKNRSAPVIPARLFEGIGFQLAHHGRAALNDLRRPGGKKVAPRSAPRNCLSFSSRKQIGVSVRSSEYHPAQAGAESQFPRPDMAAAMRALVPSGRLTVRRSVLRPRRLQGRCRGR